MKVSEETKKRQKRGKGVGADYQPWIRTREFTRDSGIRSQVIDWKTGRQMHLLSLNEVHWFYQLRWRDDVIDIREQFPLDKTTTDYVADHLKVRKPTDIMTTDMLVTYIDKGFKKDKAYSVKNSESDVFGDIDSAQMKRRIELLRIEMGYWHLKDTEYEIVFGDRQINAIYADNIAAVVEMYNPNLVVSKQDFLCFLIARKYLTIPTMATEPLNFPLLTNQYVGTLEKRNEWIKKIAADNHVELPATLRSAIKAIGE